MRGSSFLAALLAALLTSPAFAQQTQAPQFTISTIAGTGKAGFSGDGGPAVKATLSNPLGLTLDVAGNLYFADFYNNRVRRISPDGTITTYVGDGIYAFSGDGGSAINASLQQPNTVATDSIGNLYVGDFGNHVRKITPSGTITTVAGNGTRGYTGDGGGATSAEIDFPGGLALDAAGNLLISSGDDGNGDLSAIRKVAPNGMITTVAGNGIPGYSGDGGPAVNATVNLPTGLAIAPNGDLYFADQLNHRIRKISNGIITTIAGNGTAGFSGDGGPATAAELDRPTGICFDSAGNLYIADRQNNRVRVVLSDGMIATVAGNGVSGASGDGGLALDAAIVPWGITMSGSNLYVSGAAVDNTIRMLVPLVPVISPGGIISPTAFGGFSAVAQGSFIEIYGSNLAADARGWSVSDFNGINAPTSLDGTSVTIGGQSAFVSYISPNQVDALVPSNVPTGMQKVIVTTATGATTPFTVTVNALEPGLLAPSSFSVDGMPYAAAFNPDGTYALPSGVITGIASHPASPGDTIILYGTGFGPVTPSIPAGQLVQQANMLASDFQVSLGGVAANVSYAGLAPKLTGVYQFNIVVPNVTGTVPLTFTLAGVTGTQALNIAVGN